MSSLTLTIRKLELQRRMESLPAEITGWIDRTEKQLKHNGHNSQMKALKKVMDTIINKQKDLLGLLTNSQGNASNFQDAAFKLVIEINRAQRVWDFFRDKLEQRFYPGYQNKLSIADTVAWDCYRSIMDRAFVVGVVPGAALPFA